MISSIIKNAINQRIMVLFIAFILMVAGIISLKQTPLDAIPDLSDIQVIVKTSYPGQAPQVVEDQVTYPLTSAMLAVPGATTVRGYSFFGDSYVYVLFEDGTDLYWARSRVLEFLSQVAGNLPADAKPKLGPDATGVGWVYQYALIDRSGQHNLDALTSIQNWFLKYELQSVEGVAEVATIGGMVKQYQVVVDPTRLHEYGLTFAEIRSSIQRGNMETGGSVIEMAEAEYMVRARGYITNLDDIRALPVRISAGGTPLLLGDVADVSSGPQMRRGISDFNGEGEAVGGVIVMRYGENALTTIGAVKAKLEMLKASLPDGVEIVETYDRSSLINRAVDTLQEKLVEEFLVVSLICLLFLLHFRSSLVIILSLPLGILAAFTVMNLQGLNANIMSLGGIAIAIGAMVDAAIVMIEALHTRMEKETVTPENRWRIVYEATSEVGPALFFSLLIITVSFLPIFALEAQEGRMFKPLAFTKTYAMAAAAILSVTLVPVLMGYLVRGTIRPANRNPLNRGLTALYRPLLQVTLSFPKTAIIVSVLAAGTALYPAGKLGSDFMPELAEGDILYMPSAFPGISVGKMRQIIQQTDRMIMTVPEVLSTYAKAGRADSATDPAPLTMVETIIRLKPKEEWREGITFENIKDELDKAVQVPGLTNAWVMPIKNRIDMLATGIKTPIGIKLAGPDLNEISKIGILLEGILKKVPGTTSVYAERVVGGRYITIDINRAAAARYGMNIAEIQDIVRTSIGGIQVAETVEGRERYPINLRFPRSSRTSPEQLRNLPVVTRSGAHVRLGDLTTIKIDNGPGMIRSENARLSGWVYIDIADSDIGSYIARAKAAVNTGLKLPSGYALSWSGQFEFMERAKEKLVLIVPFTIALIVMILFMAFRRFSDVALILLSLPLALSGGLWLLYVLGYNISIAVGVGFIALAGVAVEIAVVMILFLNQAYKGYRKADGTITVTDARKATIDGALMRLRPIAMTVVTIVAGLMPIMFGSGTGSEVMRPIAAPMIGGMLSATVLTIIVIPALYFIINSKNIRHSD